MTEDLSRYVVYPFRDQPVVVLDLETTGLSPLVDRIFEFAAVKMLPDGTQEVLTHRCDPRQPIPPTVADLTGVTDADVVGLSPFTAYAAELWHVIADLPLVGYNIHLFDLPFLRAEFTRAGLDVSTWSPLVIDVGTLYRRLCKRRLVDAVQHYLHRPPDDAHGALPDVLATFDVLLAMYNAHPGLPHDLAALAEQCQPRRSENPFEALDDATRDQLLTLWSHLVTRATATATTPATLLADIIATAREDAPL